MRHKPRCQPATAQNAPAMSPLCERVARHDLPLLRRRNDAIHDRYGASYGGVAVRVLEADASASPNNPRALRGDTMNTARQAIVNASAHQIPLPGGMFHAVITSPPYWGLRKYAGQQLIDWPEVAYSPMPGLPPLVIPAQRAALGLEDTPEAYIGHLVLVFREVKRVMRDDGVGCLNLGDSFSE